jgi:hypothetical protein
MRTHAKGGQYATTEGSSAARNERRQKSESEGVADHARARQSR